MSALQEFESVEYRLTGDPDSPTLEWWPKEKLLGPNYLKFDLGLYGSEDGDLGFVVYAKHTRTWLNSLGAEWRNEVQLGYFNNLSTSFYQPLDVAQRFSSNPNCSGPDRGRMFSTTTNDWRATSSVTAAASSTSAPISITTPRFAPATCTRAVMRAWKPARPYCLENERSDAGLTMTATFDSRDTPFNPTRGVAAALEYAYVRRFSRRQTSTGSASNLASAWPSRSAATSSG